MTDAPEGNGVPLAGLDWEKVGRSLAMLAPTSVLLHHATIESTIRHYVHPEPLTETDFIKDLLTLPLEKFVDKWYGGPMNAAKLASETVAGALLGPRPRKG